MKGPRVCELCSRLSPYKLTSLYARWYPLNDQSVGYVLKACDACVNERLTSSLVQTTEALEDIHNCPICGSSDDDDLTYTWVTLFPRQCDALRTIAIDCSACAASFRRLWQGYGRRLADRPPPTPDGAGEVWEAIGIVPRNA